MRKSEENSNIALILPKSIDKIANVNKQHRKPIFIYTYGPDCVCVYMYIKVYCNI